MTGSSGWSTSPPSAGPSCSSRSPPASGTADRRGCAQTHVFASCEGWISVQPPDGPAGHRCRGSSTRARVTPSAEVSVSQPLCRWATTASAVARPTPSSPRRPVFVWPRSGRAVHRVVRELLQADGDEAEVVGERAPGERRHLGHQGLDDPGDGGAALLTNDPPGAVLAEELEAPVRRTACSTRLGQTV